jgi:hypothetical protein
MGSPKGLLRFTEWKNMKCFQRDGNNEKLRQGAFFAFGLFRELGMSLSDLARVLEMSIPGFGYAVEKGKIIVQDNKYQLIG